MEENQKPMGEYGIMELLEFTEIDADGDLFGVALQ